MLRTELPQASRVVRPASPSRAHRRLHVVQLHEVELDVLARRDVAEAARVGVGHVGEGAELRRRRGSPGGSSPAASGRRRSGAGRTCRAPDGRRATGRGSARRARSVSSVVTNSSMSASSANESAGRGRGSRAFIQVGMTASFQCVRGARPASGRASAPITSRQGDDLADDDRSGQRPRPPRARRVSERSRGCRARSRPRRLDAPSRIAAGVAAGQPRSRSSVARARRASARPIRTTTVRPTRGARDSSTGR